MKPNSMDFDPQVHSRYFRAVDAEITKRENEVSMADYQDTLNLIEEVIDSIRKGTVPAPEKMADALAQASMQLTNAVECHKGASCE